MLITTRYQGPRGFRGSRIIATLRGRGRITRTKSVPYDSALSSEDNHMAAAVALFRKLEPCTLLILSVKHMADCRPGYRWDVQGHMPSKEAP